MFGYLFAIFALVAVLAVVAGIQSSKRTKEAWQQAGRTLALAFTPGGFLSTPTLRGEIADCSVHVDTYTQSHGKSSTTYTRIRIGYPRRLDVTFRLTRQGFFSSVASLFGAQDVQIGDRGFDESVVVKGPDESRLRAFLTDARRLRILRLLRTHERAVIASDEIEWSRRGVVRKASELTSLVRMLVSAAAAIAAPDEADAPLEEALAARKVGDIDRAVRVLKTARETRLPPPVPSLPPPEDEAHMEAELQQLAHRPPEPTPAPPAGTDRPPAPPPAPAPSTPSTDGDALDVASVCRALFVEPSSNTQAQKRFEDRYADRVVAWEGTLERVSEFTFDFVLGSEGGTKARFVVYEVPGAVIGGNDVGAVVALPKGEAQALEPHKEKRLKFSGRLVKVDTFMRNLFLKDGAWDLA